MLWPCICSKPSPTTALCSSRRILHVVRSCSIYIVVIRPPSSTPTSCCDKRSTSQTSVDKRYSTSKCTTSWARHDVHDPLVCIGHGQQHCLHTSIVCAACGRSWTHFLPPSRTITASSSRSAKENSPLSMAPRQRISPPSSSLEQESREPLVPKLQAVDEESEKARQHHDYFNLFALVSSGKLEC